MVSRILALALAFALALGSSSGCLLRADPPPFTDQCVDEDIGDAIGDSIVAARPVASASTYDCIGSVHDSDSPDYVFEWTAPATGTYEFTLNDATHDLVFGVTSPMCGGEIEGCRGYIGYDEYDDSMTYSAQAGEILHIVVEYYDPLDYDDEFTLSILPS